MKICCTTFEAPCTRKLPQIFAKQAKYLVKKNRFRQRL